MFQVSKLIYECFMIMLMLCKSSYARLTPEVLHGARHLELEVGVVGDRHELGVAWAP